MKKIRVMPDYGFHALWNFESEDKGDIDPRSLPISVDLALQLESWASEYDKTLNQDYPPDSGFKTKELEVKFVASGYELAVMLSYQLEGY